MRPKPSPTFIGSHELQTVLSNLRFTCLDVGARGGFTKDLIPLAPSVDAIGFEPDAGECERLNVSAAAAPESWRSLRFLPTALGRDVSDRTLYLYRQRGCSSLYEADLAVARHFGRADDFRLDSTVDLPTMPLDDAAERFGFTDAVFMKIDIQGAELEVLRSGPALLHGSLLAVRTEVEFVPIYQDQPLYGELESYLRTCGFMPMGFVELHSWRRVTRNEHPSLARGSIPYSRGQIAHGDMLFFRDAAGLPDETPGDVETLLKAAFLALTYEFVDYALAIMTRKNVATFLEDKYGLNVRQALSNVSYELARRYRQSDWRHQLLHLRDPLIRGVMRGFLARYRVHPRPAPS